VRDSRTVSAGTGAPALGSAGPGKGALELALAGVWAIRGSPASFRPNAGLCIDDHLLRAMTVKMTAVIFLSPDGVYQGNGGPDEDRRGRASTLPRSAARGTT
jgi:hypothetical protein